MTTSRHCPADRPARPASAAIATRAPGRTEHRRLPAPAPRRRRPGAGAVVVAAQAGAALGGSPLAAPERRPASSTVVDVTVRPGDSLWSIVERTFPGDDPRPMVDELMRGPPRRAAGAGRGRSECPGSRGRAVGRDRVATAGEDAVTTVAACAVRTARSIDDKVVDSRPADEGAAVRRRRECLACGAAVHHLRAASRSSRSWW